MSRFWKVYGAIARWAFVVFALLAWITRLGGESWHLAFGALAFALAASRIVQAFVGPAAYRLSWPVKLVGAYSPGWWLRLKSGIGKTAAGQFPLSPGAYTLFAVLSSALLTGLSGVLLTTDRLWAEHWLMTTHRAASTVLLLSMIVHLLLTRLARLFVPQR